MAYSGASLILKDVQRVGRVSLKFVFLRLENISLYVNWSQPTFLVQQDVKRCKKKPFELERPTIFLHKVDKCEGFRVCACLRLFCSLIFFLYRNNKKKCATFLDQIEINLDGSKFLAAFCFFKLLCDWNWWLLQTFEQV